MDEKIIARIKSLTEDESCSEALVWQKKNPGAPVVGFLPAYIPREIVYAAGGLAVGIWGGGAKVEIVHGDAYFQSYICHIPRSITELASQGHFKTYDGLVFPSICDVIRNLSGMWKLLFPEQWVKYLDLPQNLDPKLGGVFYRKEMEHLARLTLGREPDDSYRDKLLQAIKLVNRQQDGFNRLLQKRQEVPHLIPIDEFYGLYRSALVLHPEEHIELMNSYLQQVDQREGKAMDSIRVMVAGAFCEQPPMGLLRSLERAGCYIINHDFLTGLHWFVEPVKEEGDPFDNLVDAYLNKTRMASFKYQGCKDRGEELIKEFHECKADGVILAAPSFCDPSLLDRPMLQDSLAAAGIPYTAFKYAENTGQYQPIKEQAGTFSDSIRLWS